ncbi:MAG: hypothetical protein ACYC4K_09105 [Thiobacillus sp.]
MKAWRITGRQCDAPPSDWRAQLATRLGHRPRRLGEWVELALWGARQCLDQAGEEQLPSNTLLTLSTLNGSDIALRSALTQAKDGVPMPITFLNSQPAQSLPALAQYLGWQGNGRCLTTREPSLALQLACLEAGSEGVLAGWVDEDAPGKSIWLRLQSVETNTALFHNADFAALAESRVTLLTFEGMQLQVGA